MSMIIIIALATSAMRRGIFKPTIDAITIRAHADNRKNFIIPIDFLPSVCYNINAESPEGEGLSPLLVSPPTDCCNQSRYCDYCFDYYQCPTFHGGGLFILFVFHTTLPPFCIYYTILIEVCQGVFEKKFNFFEKFFIFFLYYSTKTARFVSGGFCVIIHLFLRHQQQARR